MLLSEPRLLAAAFAVSNRPVSQRRNALAALSAGKRLILVGARRILVGRSLIVAEKNLIPVG